MSGRVEDEEALILKQFLDCSFDLMLFLICYSFGAGILALVDHV